MSIVFAVAIALLASAVVFAILYALHRTLLSREFSRMIVREDEARTRARAEAMPRAVEKRPVPLRDVTSKPQRGKASELMHAGHG